MQHKPSTILTLPTGTNSDLTGLIFKPYSFETQQAIQITEVFWVRPTTNESVASIQKMGDDKPTNIPRPHRKA
jgi:hypothetical protein